MKNLKIKSLCVAVVVFMMAAAMAQAATWTVNQTDAGANFATFAAAVANPALGEGDFIQFTDATPVTYTEGTIDWTGKPNYIHVNVLHPGNITLTAHQLNIPGYLTYAFYDINFSGVSAGDSIITLANNTTYFINCSFTGVANWQRGVDIAAGATYFMNCTFKDVAGGWAMITWIDWSATVAFTDCKFENIQCTAIWMRGSKWDGNTCPSTVTVDRCTFTNVSQLKDTTYPAIKMMAGSVAVTKSTINLGDGYLLEQDGDAAAYTDIITASFNDCKISKTHVDAPLIMSKAAPAMNVSFGNSILDVGDAIVWGQSTVEATKSNFKFNHCLLMQNFAGWGAALTADDSALDTFELTNSIIESKNEGIHLPSAAQLSTASDHNLLNKGGWQDNNIGANSMRDLDPRFVDAAAGIYRLQEDSPCVNKGVVTSLVKDIAGNVRPMPAGTNPDIGPYESIYSPIELSSFSAE